MKTFYDFEANNIKGQTVSMKAYEGKTVVVVNTASKCGFTPQYEGLEALYQKYKNQGLVILGFPCNQFGKQESGSSDEIEEFCQINYGVTFPLFEKIEVNGKNAHPIFKFLKEKQSSGIFGSKIKWNFTKFIINSKGVPVKRFSPTTKPEKMEKTIIKLLQQ
jgi:glutathione peroxidase